MDNRKGDRHRNRTRIHASGAEKKQKARRAEEEAAKSRKISEFLFQPQQVTQTSDKDDGDVTDNTGDVNVSESTDSIDTGDVNVTESITNDTNDDNETNTNGVGQQPVSGGNDIGLWPEVIPNEMCDYWVLKGVTDVQHCDEKLLSQHSTQQHRNDRKVQRKCTTSLFHRQNHNGEMVFRNWLCFSPAKGCVFCFHCRLMCSQLDAPSRVSASLVHGGYCDWRHALERLRNHELSKEHINATIAFTTRSNAAGRIDTALAHQVQREQQYWRSVLKRVVSVVKFIAERGLAFRGCNEMIGSPRNGNYLGLLELIAQYDSFLAQHISMHASRGTGHTNYLSSTIMEEIITIIGKQVLGEIIARVKRSKYYSISLDSTPDESHIDQLTLVLRYMEDDGPVERFVTFMANRGHKAEEMFNALMEFFREQDLDIADCRGQSYDNASAMSGIYNGLQAKVIQKNSLATWIPCTAHSLNLVGQNAAECCMSAVKFFDFLEKLYVFFTASTHRYQVLTEALKTADVSLTVKRVTTTRWSCRSDATKALKHGYQRIKNALEEMCNDTEEKAQVRCEAEGLVTRLNQLETGIYTVFWNDILQRANATSQGLQDAKLDLNTAVASLISLKVFVSSKRDSFDDYERQGKDLSGSAEYTQSKARKRTRNVRLNPLDYGQEEEAQLTPSQSYKIESFLPVVDQFIASLDKRLQAYQECSARFSCFRHLSEMSEEEIKESAKRLVAAYPDDLENALVDELCQFVAFANIFKDDEPEDISTELFLYQLIISKRVQATFSNVEIALRIYLVLMVANCSGERSFSKLKLIKNRLRTSMVQDRLVNLAIMSIESDVMGDLDLSAIIDQFALNKSRKVAV